MAKAKWYVQASIYLLVAVVLSLGIVAVPGNILADGVTILFEDFEGGLPGNWTVVDNGATCLHTCCHNWTDSDPCARGPLDGCSGIFMIADSDCCFASPMMDT